MAGFDPSAALALDAALLAQTAAADAAALTFETQAAQQLIATIQVGDVLTAEVLPPQNGNDRLSLLGQTVNAQLPPGIMPGEQLLLQVTSLDGNRISVRNLGLATTAEAQAAAQAAQDGVDPAIPRPQGILTTPAAQDTPSAPASTPPARPPDAPVSRPVITARDPQQSGGPAPRLDPAELAAQFAQGRPGRAVFGTPAPSIPPPPGVAEQLPSGTAARPPGGDALPPPSSGLLPPRGGAPVAPPRELFVAASMRVPQGQQPVAPPLTQRGDVRGPAQTSPPQPQAPPALGNRSELIAQVVEAARRQPAMITERSGMLTPRVTPALLQEFAHEASLLARLRVPVTPATLAAARSAPTAAATLTNVFARLESALAKVVAPNQQVTTLRALLPFIGRIDLSNVRALPQQLSAYVSHVLEGSEGKIADLVRAFAQSDTSPAPQAAVPSGAPADLATQAKAAERTVALAQTLKAAIASVAASNAGAAPSGVTQALNDALRTVTGVQLQALANQDADPKTLVVPLPVQYYAGGRPAEMRVHKDAPNGGRIDPENFSISFVLDTKTMGTVGIDVRTSGRTVTVNVKTEAPRAADRFRSTFEDLRGRLSQLRYRIAGMNADALARGDVPKQNVEIVDGSSQPGEKRQEWRA